MELEQCVAKIVAGEKEKFNVLVAHFQQPVYNLAWRMTGEQEEARDLTQEIFLKIYKNLSTYDQKNKLSTWIFRIATNTCIDFLRKKREMLFQDENQGKLVLEKTGLCRDQIVPHQVLENQELREKIQQKINMLPADYRVVIILKYVNELTFEEIALILNQPVSTVKTKLYRGREMLRGHLAETWNEERGKSEWVVKK